MHRARYHRAVLFRAIFRRISAHNSVASFWPNFVFAYCTPKDQHQFHPQLLSLIDVVWQHFLVVDCCLDACSRKAVCWNIDERRHRCYYFCIFWNDHHFFAGTSIEWNYWIVQEQRMILWSGVKLVGCSRATSATPPSSSQECARSSAYASTSSHLWRHACV